VTAWRPGFSQARSDGCNPARASGDQCATHPAWRK
jgi:hypothetical protein